MGFSARSWGVRANFGLHTGDWCIWVHSRGLKAKVECVLNWMCKCQQVGFSVRKWARFEWHSRWQRRCRFDSLKLRWAADSAVVLPKLLTGWSRRLTHDARGCGWRWTHWGMKYWAMTLRCSRAWLREGWWCWWWSYFFGLKHCIAALPHGTS